MRQLVVLPASLVLLAAGACASTGSTMRSSANAQTKFIHVAAERKPCTGVAPMMCLQIREDESAPWQNYYGKIEGFTPEPGIEYRLRVLEETVPNPPADASSKRWTLDLIVEQRVKTR